MSFNINDIKANFKFGGARPTLFSVLITNPVAAQADAQMPIKCKAASIPAFTIGVIPVPYFGRVIKVPGDREYQPWITTIDNDEDFNIRHALETWHNAMNAAERNIATEGSAPNNYKSQGTVTQYGKDGEELRIYQFNGIWPSEISDIPLDWDARDQIETFTVTWQFDSFEVVGGKTGIFNK